VQFGAPLNNLNDTGLDVVKGLTVYRLYNAIPTLKLINLYSGASRCLHRILEVGLQA
jgi:hypothetical protein